MKKILCTLLAVALYLSDNAAAAAPVPVVAGSRVHVVGDSITQFGWPTATGSLFDQINATWAAPSPIVVAGHATGGVAHASGGVGVAQPTTPTRRAITATTSGVAGNKASDIAAAVASRIVAFNPQILFVEVGVNDLLTPTDPTTFAATYDSILTQTLTALPSCQIICLSVLSYNEQWQAGPAWPSDAAPTYDNPIRTACTNRGGVYVDLRTPLLAYEVAHNLPGPPGAGLGIVTSDGIHPIVTSGQVLMGTWVFPSVSVAP